MTGSIKYTEKGIFNRICPGPISRLLYSSTSDYRLLKAVLGFPLGILFGIVLYFALVQRLELPADYDLYLGAFFMIIATLGFALSVQVRCILFLILPTIFGTSGRSYVGTFALAYLLKGPVNNLIVNSKEVTRAISCSGELAVNMTRARMGIKLMPLYDIMKELKVQAFNIRNITDKAQKGFQPMQLEIFDDFDLSDIKNRIKSKGGNQDKEIDEKYAPKDADSTTDKIRKAYAKKMEFQCADVFTMAVDHCKEVFRDTHRDCEKKVSKVASWALCWPLKIDGLCNMAKIMNKVTGGICDSLNVIDQGFGQIVDTASQATKVFGKNFHVNMQYKIMSFKEELARFTPEDIAKAIRYEFEWRQKIMDVVAVLLQRILAFMFLYMLWSAFQYHDGYTSNLEYDNVYVTDYFHHIDKRRWLLNKQVLLPFKKQERKTIIYPTSLQMTSDERYKLITGTSKLFCTAFAYGMIIFLDKVFFEILTLINSSCHIEFTQKGTHHVKMNVEGTGMMAKLVRDLLQGFNSTHRLDQDTSNYEAYGLRVRRVISSFFYRKREKKRVLHLYNDLLKKRKGYMKHLIHMVRKKARQHQLWQSSSLAMSFVRTFPHLCACLRTANFARKKCIVCDEKETAGFVQCPTEGCEFVYCRSCWQEVKVCYACRDDDDWSSASSSDPDID